LENLINLFIDFGRKEFLKGLKGKGSIDIIFGTILNNGLFQTNGSW
jgi:hypothetical protein